jgi:hypothetical protein
MLEPENRGVWKNEKKKNLRRRQRKRLKLQDIPEARTSAAGVGGTASARGVCGFDFIGGHIASGLHRDALGFAANAQLVNAGTSVLGPDAFDLPIWPADRLGRLS